MTMRISKDRIDMDDKILRKPVLQDYGEKATITNSGTSYTIDLTTGNAFSLTLTGNCSFTFSNPPASGTAGIFSLALTQDSTGGRTVTWPAAVAWPGGAAPTLSNRQGSIDVFSFLTTNAGSTWYGFQSGTFPAAIPTIAFRASATSSTETITTPSTVQAGDVAFLFEFSSTAISTTGRWFKPAGWTPIIGYAAGATGSLSTSGDTNWALQVHYKILSDADASAVVTGLNATNDRKTMVVFSGRVMNVKLRPINNSGYTTGNPSAQTVTASGGTTPLIILAAAVDADLSGNGAFSTASPAFDGTVTSALCVGYKIYNSSPANHSIDMNDLGSNWLVSFHVELS